MKMPVSIRSEFIGKLIEIQKIHKHNRPVFDRLCMAVKQCREFNGGKTPHEQVFPYMVKTQQELAKLGVMVG